MKQINLQISLYFLLIAISTPLRAQVSSVISKRSLEIGERLELKLKANFNDSTGLTIKQEELPPNLEYLAESDWISIDGHFEKKWDLVAWDSGQYLIPAIEVKLENKGSFKTNPHYIQVGDIVLSDSIALQDIKPIIEEEATIEDYLSIVYLLAGILLFLGLIWYVYKQNRRQDKIIDPPYENLIRPAHIIANEALEKLKQKDYLAEGKEKEYQSALSLIIRRYLDQRFGSSLLEKTTSQVLNELDKIKGIPNNIKEILQQKLPQTDLIKYAGQSFGISFNQEILDILLELINKTTTQEEQKYKLEDKDDLLQQAIESGLRRRVSLGAVSQLNKLLLDSHAYGTETQKIKLYRWSWEMPFVKADIASIELPTPIINWHIKGLGSFHALYNKIGSKLIQSGLIGSVLILILQVFLIPSIPFCILIDSIQRRKIFGKGNIELEDKATIRFMYSIIELENNKQ